ncbi:6-carboxytetrahydropterin synthase [Salicola sp. Rm-C-2C1-2]|uniref:6-carboxytetrahydropterin synthase n=1 Tax=Salicola sp. Rm-C-2C1-2 TaxID=3141321 RepID=UPI0032E46B1C
MNRLFVDNLTVIDFAYLDRHRGLVGESWIVDIELAGDLNEAGMVFDFGHVKSTIKAHIDHQVDHRLLVPADYPGLRWPDPQKPADLRWRLDDGTWIEHRAPAQAVAAVPGETIDRHTIAEQLSQSLERILPDNVQSVAVTLRLEAIEGAWYHYAHGLKKHDGNCQRIAHGHRSRIRILRNGQRAPDLEHYWGNRWCDIYLASAADRVETFEDDGLTYHRFSYDSDQGHFEIALPAARTEIMETDTTVEWIACYLRDETHKLEPENRFEVYAFEGVNKGAIAET